MKCFCTNCFDVKELVEYIELNGTYGHCTVCKSENIKRISADRIGRILRTYLDDHYIDRKSEVRNQCRKCDWNAAQMEAQAHQEGWQSVEEILVEDKEIFSARIPVEQRPELLSKLFAETGVEHEQYADVTERRFVPK